MGKMVDQQSRRGSDSNSFAYNGLDTRVSKTDSAGTTSYKRAGAYVTDSLLKSTVSSTTTDYTPGVSSREGSDSTFLHSGLKNADTQTDDGGDVSAMRRYDAFGNPLAAWGGWQGPFGYGGPYGYQTDADHGLMLLGHRYYEADTGRFLTRDPIKDGRNWYGYCGGSQPLTRNDATGLAPSKVGPPGTDSRYRTDLSQRPRANLHILWNDGTTSTISDRGGEQLVHNGKPQRKLNRAERRAYRPIIRTFVKKAARRVLLVLLVVDLVTDPAQAAKDSVFYDEVNSGIEAGIEAGCSAITEGQKRVRSGLIRRSMGALDEEDVPALDFD